MQSYKKILFTAGLAATFIAPAVGQNTNTPYSRYGYGVLEGQAIGASKAMGGISYGVKGLNTNPANPASYASVDSLTFIFDIGISYNKSRLSEGNAKQTDDNGGLDYIAMQFPIAKKLGMSFGILPYSSVGYEFGKEETNGSLRSRKTFSGSGNISQFYTGLAYSPMKNLSVGANISYLFGSTSYYRTLTILNATNPNYESWYHKLTMNSLKFDFGLQYTLPIDKKNELTIGAVFTPKVSKTGKIERQYHEISSASTLLEGDTIKYTGKEAPMDLPTTFGLGFTWTHNQRLVIGADVTYQEWSKARYSSHLEDDLNNSNRFNNRWKLNGGIEYSIDPKDRNFVKRMKFRGGLNYSNSYINVKDKNAQISGYKEYGGTFGLGLPIRDPYTGRSSYINLGFEYTSINPNKKGLVKEQYFGVTLGVCINDFWFMKNKFR